MDKVVIITGASRGIGAAAARAAGREGWRVVVNYRNAADAAEAVVGDIRAQGGVAEAVHGDVSREEDVLRLFGRCMERFGRLDGLVNNAGILPQVGRLRDIDPARWAETFAINVTGSYLCCRAAAQLMSTRTGGRGGAIVNLSSMAAVLGGAGEFVDYAASKGAIESLTVGLSRELGPEGIRVNAVRPGLIDTEIHESAGDADRVQRLASGVPLGRAGTAGEAAEAVAWLLSDAASYVTGTVMAVSGGR